MRLAIRTRLGFVAALLLLIAFASTATHRTSPSTPMWFDGLVRPEPEPNPCLGCPVVEQAAAETAPWDESAAIPTARFESRHGPLTLTVEVRPPSPAVGAPTRVRLVVTSVRAGLLSLGLAFGDEVPPMDGHVMAGSCAPLGDQPRNPPTIHRKTLVRDVRFVAAGSHRVRAAAKVHSCRGNGDVDGGGFVPVLASRLSTNGPKRPSLFIEPLALWNDVQHQRAVTLTLRSGDDDGYVRRLDVDWGDGSAPETLGAEPDGCGAGPIFVRRAHHQWATHIYTRPGTYRVTATATSAGCDGRFRQVARAHYAATVARG